MTEQPGSRKVCLVIDEPDLSSRLVHALESADYEVVAFTEGNAALDALRRTPMDLAIVDVELSGLDGLQVLKMIRQQSDCLVLLLSTSPAEMDCILALELGGHDYVVKPFSLRELVTRTRVLFRRLERQQAPSESVRPPGLKYEGLRLDLERRTLANGAKETSLTVTECSILSLMMKAPSRVFSREDLLVHPISKRGQKLSAVRVHVGNLRKKILALEVGFPPLQSIRGVGYRFDGNSS